jgi:hypothetical protein
LRETESSGDEPKYSAEGAPVQAPVDLCLPIGEPARARSRGVPMAYRDATMTDRWVQPKAAAMRARDRGHEPPACVRCRAGPAGSRRGAAAIARR